MASHTLPLRYAVIVGSNPYAAAQERGRLADGVSNHLVHDAFLIHYGEAMRKIRTSLPREIDLMDAVTSRAVGGGGFAEVDRNRAVVRLARCGTSSLW